MAKFTRPLAQKINNEAKAEDKKRMPKFSAEGDKISTETDEDVESNGEDEGVEGLDEDFEDGDVFNDEIMLDANAAAAEEHRQIDSLTTPG